MRIFETFRPKNNIIKKYVQYYYLEIDEHNSEREFTCFPHYNTAISIYKSHKRYKDATVEFKPDLLPLQIFTPIRKDILTVKQLGKIYRIVIIFNPLGIQNFFDNLNFTDYFTDFSFFKKDEINQLFTTTDIETLRNLLDSFLIKRFCNNENEIVKNAIFKIFDHSQSLKVSELSKSLIISRRHLNRLFNENLGISVKNFQEIVRFRKAMTHKIFEKPLDNFTEISYEYNYSDQSHLNKVFSKLTHNSPAKFLKKGTYLGSEDIFWHLK
jgi:AraC-like DNA-binding protein